MARHVSVESAIDKNKVSSENAWLILLDIDVVDPNTREVTETIHVVQNDENFVFNGIAYTAGNFEINIDQQQNTAPSVTLSVEDQNGMITTRLEAYAGAVFSTVRMQVINSARPTSEPELDQTFQVLSSNVKNYVVTAQLGAENPLSIQFPKHTQMKDRCAWRYKGYGCAYAGSMPSCDYTRDGANGCAAHGNLARFRGLTGMVRANV